jgi:Lipocalin-like domain
MVNQTDRRAEDLGMTELRQALLGGWLLESFVSRDADTGAVRYPFGEHPAGLILYTADGYMSAQLTPGPGAEYIAYGGRFHVDEPSATVRHDVLVSNMPELLTQAQFRHAQVDSDRLTLSASQTSADGATTHSTLVWRRNPES